MKPTSSSTPSGPPGHPEELLAGFVDGTASADERALVERHLAACERCRLEVELAARARAALAALPELEPPGLADRGLEALQEWARVHGATLPEPSGSPAPAAPRPGP
ncbi:MAG TPA: zf-HC2 domain-containing protein, partial [Actinomycetota bacterium]|nr:zf-HC2 domain-containing protein [Actinomycetota bacterium]